MVVALAMGRTGIDLLLVASQVVLSIVLPFVMLPLLWLTTNKKIMSVKKPKSSSSTLMAGCLSTNPDTSPASMLVASKIGSSIEPDVEAPSSSVTEIVDYSNGKITAGAGYLILAVVVVANAYVIVTLAMGEGG